MKEQTEFSKIFNETLAQGQSQIVEKVYEKITYSNPFVISNFASSNFRN